MFSRAVTTGEVEASVRLATGAKRRDGASAGIFIGTPPAALKSPVNLADLLHEALERERDQRHRDWEHSHDGHQEHDYYAHVPKQPRSPRHGQTTTEDEPEGIAGTWGALVTGGGAQDTGPQCRMECKSQEVRQSGGGDAFDIQVDVTLGSGWATTMFR